MRESIRGYVDAVVEESVGQDADLAAEVAGVRDVVVGSEDLRVVLSDPGVAPHVRRNVFEDLFAARIGPGALLVVLYTVDAGRAPDLVDDLDWLVGRTAAAHDDLSVSGPSVLGHHAALERIGGYADRVLASAEDTATLGEIEDELFRFERIVIGSDQLSEALTGRDLPARARAGLVADLLGAKATPASTRLAAYATTIGRPRDYTALLDALIARVAAESDRRLAEVRASVELTDAQQQRLAAALGRIVGQRVDVRVIVDPSVLGGFVATIGDTVVDGSVRHRLDLLRERLVVSEANQTDQGAQS